MLLLLLPESSYNTLAYIKVWYGTVKPIHIQMTLFGGGRESVDTMGYYFWRMCNGVPFTKAGRGFHNVCGQFMTGYIQIIYFIYVFNDDIYEYDIHMIYRYRNDALSDHLQFIYRQLMTGSQVYHYFIV